MNWPFLYSYQPDGSVITNRAPRTSTYDQACDVGPALM